jgi:hypothetical protein
MSPFDVPPDEMGIDPEIANEDLEALFAGYGRDKNLDLTRFVDDLSTAFPAQTPAATAHFAAIANEAQLLADKGDPVARPASNAVVPATRASRPPKRRRNTMEDRKARILIRIAAPVVALFAVLGIMGSAGALPRTLQHLTSHAAGIVGFDLPTGDDEGNDTTADDQGDQNEQGDDVKDATDEGDQGDDGTTTDNSDQGDQNDQGDSTSSDSTDQGDQNEGDTGDTSTGSSDQGDDNSQGDSTGSSDQGDQNDQGDDSTGTSGGGSSENDQGGGGSSQDDQGDSSGDGGSGSSGSGSSGSGSSGSGDNQD